MLKEKVNQAFESFNVEGLLGVLEEQYGRKFMLEYSDVFYLWYCVQRNMVKENITDIKNYLNINNVFDNKTQTDSTVRRYFKFRNLLPDLSESQHRRLNKANQFLNPLVNFQSVGNKTLGIIKEEETKTNNVIDITEGNHTIIAKIDSEGMISWRNFDLTENQIDWIETNNIKYEG